MAVENSEELSSGELAEELADAVAERKGQNIKILDLRELTSIADYFVLADARSRRHLKNLGEELISEIKKAGLTPFKHEGLETESWVILDLFDVVVHLFRPDRREFYALDDYWADAPVEFVETGEDEDYE